MISGDTLLVCYIFLLFISIYVSLPYRYSSIPLAGKWGSFYLHFSDLYSLTKGEYLATSLITNLVLALDTLWKKPRVMDASCIAMTIPSGQFDVHWSFSSRFLVAFFLGDLDLLWYSYGVVVKGIWRPEEVINCIQISFPLLFLFPDETLQKLKFKPALKKNVDETWDFQGTNQFLIC